MRTMVELVALVDVLHQRLAGFGMGDRQHPGLQLVEQRPSIRGRDAALRLAPLQVQEDLAEVPLRVGPRPRPVDMPPRQEKRLAQPIHAALCLPRNRLTR